MRNCTILVALLMAPTIAAQAPTPFAVEEATVASVHAALAAGQVSCLQLVRAYLDRIASFDDAGPTLKAIIAVNPQALEMAAAKDMERQQAPAGAGLPPLHCIPVILKDNYDTADMPTTGGSLTLATSQPPDDAFVVRRLRDAGAIVIAKSNLTELARGGTTVSSLGGQTRNPYDLTRTPGGSSGGTGAAIAANFGLLGTGSDTGQSIRSPASAQSLVGLRATRGLVSRDGVIPLSFTQDEVGPITRTVEDAARMLQVMAGYDPADPITAFSHGHIPASYLSALDKSGLKGARIGVLMDVFGTAPPHQEVNAVVEAALAQMTALGATVVRIRVPKLDELTSGMALSGFEFRTAFNGYLASLGAGAPVKNLDAFVAANQIHSSLKAALADDARQMEGVQSPVYKDALLRREALRRALMTAMADHRVGALLYPHQQRLVVPIGEEQVERNGVLSNGTGFPALTFPGGFSPPTTTAPLGVPVGIELLGPEWSEPTLFRLAYAFEQHTHARRPPRLTR